MLKRIILLSMLLMILSTAGVGAGEMIIPKRDISYEYTVEPIPKMGEIFTVTATFQINQDIYYHPEAEYGVMALIGTLPRQELISGDTAITGKFAKGELQTISATYRVTKGTQMSIGLMVKTTGADTLGGWPYFACNSWTFEEYRISEPKVIPGKTYTDSLTGVKITAIHPDSLKIPVTDKYGRPRVITKTKDEFERSYKDEDIPPPPPSGIKEILLVQSDNKGYEQIHVLRVSEQYERILLFRDMNTDGILVPTFADSIHDLGTITHKDDSTFLFMPKNRTGEAVFLGQIDGQPFELKIFLSSWLLDGNFKYTDPFGNMDNRMQYILLKIYNKDYYDNWVYAYETYTDALGYFSIYNSETDIMVVALSENWDCFTFYTDGHFDIGQDNQFYYYFKAFAVTGNTGYEDFTVPYEYTTLGNNDRPTAGAFNICNIIRAGKNNIGYMMFDQVPI